ncbi:MAG: CIA30 family protein [Verrucomicrobiota bacterium]
MKPIALLRLIGVALSASLLPQMAAADTKPGAWRGQSVTEFSPEQADAFNWQIVNDGVMGGLSQGKMEPTQDGIMKFSGDLSLENNGGFSMFRSGTVEFNLSNDLGLLLLVKGDGRTYDARLTTDARYRGMEVSFSGKFATTKGKWQQVKIPWTDFTAGWRGREFPDVKLDPSMVERVGILLGDKKTGPFEVEIDWIRTYGKGQGNYVERKPKPSAPTSAATTEGKERLIATAVADGRFTTLKTALDTARLTTFFQWDNPLTVFAPTDDAFAKLPDGVLEDLLKPENKERLVSVLSHHVSPGSYRLSDALKSDGIKTVQGSPLKISFNGGKVQVNDAVMIQGDVECYDGLIHVIDTVLLPPDFN